MNILGVWPVKKDVKQFSSGLVLKGYTVTFTESGGKAAIKVMNGTAVEFESGYYLDISADQGSVYGTFSISNADYFVVAYVRDFGDHAYIFGNIRKKLNAADSGGQWDGNRPR